MQDSNCCPTVLCVIGLKQKSTRQEFCSTHISVSLSASHCCILGCRRAAPTVASGSTTPPAVSPVSPVFFCVVFLCWVFSDSCFSADAPTPLFAQSRLCWCGRARWTQAAPCAPPSGAARARPSSLCWTRRRTSTRGTCS